MSRFVGFALTTGLAAGIFLSPSSDPQCGSAAQLRGGCVSGTIHGGGVDLNGQKSTGGSSGNGKGSTKGGGASKQAPPQPDCSIVPAACQTFGVVPPPVVSHPGVTLNDLKSFRPTPGVDHMQPNGWMVVGLATNFYSVVGVETQHGTLLGQPASVRFIPIAWHWIYGDGTSATRSTAGRTWAAQGIPEFDGTPTSHIYSREGTYYIDLDIVFRAEYKWADSGWTRISGSITLPANRLKATAGGAKTVLVNWDCTDNPSGPGC